MDLLRRPYTWGVALVPPRLGPPRRPPFVRSPSPWQLGLARRLGRPSAVPAAAVPQTSLAAPNQLLFQPRLGGLAAERCCAPAHRLRHCLHVPRLHRRAARLRVERQAQAVAARHAERRAPGLAARPAVADARAHDVEGLHATVVGGTQGRGVMTGVVTVRLGVALSTKQQQPRAGRAHGQACVEWGWPFGGPGGPLGGQGLRGGAGGAVGGAGGPACKGGRERPPRPRSAAPGTVWLLGWRAQTEKGAQASVKTRQLTACCAAGHHACDGRATVVRRGRTITAITLPFQPAAPNHPGQPSQPLRLGPPSVARPRLRRTYFFATQGASPSSRLRSFDW